MGRRSIFKRSLLAGFFLIFCLQFTSVAQTASFDQLAATVTPTPQPLKKIFLPNISSQNSSTLPPSGTAPSYSSSIYMLSVDSTKLYNLGCQFGTIDRNFAGSRETLVILDFGSSKIINGEYGTDLFWMGPVTITQIKNAVQNFGRGFYICADSDRSSVINIGVGTTNYGSTFSSSAYSHGVAWAKMINDLNSWFTGNGYSSQVRAVGAIDIELSWSTPASGKAWVNGYSSATRYVYYDFGTLDGCPYYSTPYWTTCANGWTMEDAWYKTFGPALAFPIPEIYNTNGINAKQWAFLSLYSVTNKKTPIEFRGVMTQYQACAQAPVGQCTGIDNTPDQGWTQLYTELKKDSRTAYFPKWATDIRWGYDQTNDPAMALDSTLPAAPAAFMNVQGQYLQALAQPDLDPQLQDRLAERLLTAQQMETDRLWGLQHPATKDPVLAPQAPAVSDGDFLAGIFDGPGGMAHNWEGSFINHWQGNIGSDFALVSAGSATEDASSGLVMVIRVSGDRAKFSKKFYSVPASSGTLQVNGVIGSQVMLSSENGSLFTFNLETETFQ